MIFDNNYGCRKIPSNTVSLEMSCGIRTKVKPRKCLFYGVFVAYPARLERATAGVGVLNSIQLNYGYIFTFYVYSAG